VPEGSRTRPRRRPPHTVRGSTDLWVRMPRCPCVDLRHCMLYHFCYLSQVGRDVMPAHRWMACSVNLFAVVLRLVPSNTEDRTNVLLPSRWLEAAAVSAGKERLNFLTLHVVEVRTGLGLRCQLRGVDLDTRSLRTASTCPVTASRVFPPDANRVCQDKAAH